MEVTNDVRFDALHIKKLPGISPAERENNMSLRTMLASRSNGPALLNGSDVPVGTKSITITVAAVRESPEGFSEPAIVDLEKPMYDKSAWAVNKTNLKVIIKDHGEDEAKLVGKTIKLEVISVRNPKTGEMVRSLAVSPKKRG